MPYKSLLQQRWAHTEAGTKALGGPEKVKEWDRESKGKKLPKHIKRFKKLHKMLQKKKEY